MTRSLIRSPDHTRESIVQWLEHVLEATGWSPSRLELLVGSSPRAAMLRPKNPEFMAHEVPVESLEILGRVIGMWRRI